MIEFASMTEQGGRDVNEDAVSVEIVDDQTQCFSVADGLGGHGRGDEAAHLAVQTAADVFRAFPEQEELTKTIFESAQKRVLFEKNERGERHSMKTTLSVLIFRQGKAAFGTIGAGSILLRSHDHSMSQLLCDVGQISPEEVRSHPDRNRLLRCIGEEWDGKSYELSPDALDYDRESAFLICTDGFWTLISDEEIEECLQDSATAQEWLDRMTAVVRERATVPDADNYTAVTVRIQ